MNYTKGKWEVKTRLNDNFIRISSLPPDTFQTIQIAEVFGTHGEDLANAHLISAAPDMYKWMHDFGLHVSVNYVEVDGILKPSYIIDEDYLELKHKILAKAEGK